MVGRKLLSEVVTTSAKVLAPATFLANDFSVPQARPLELELPQRTTRSDP
jgi:hypothetical protein